MFDLKGKLKHWKDSWASYKKTVFEVNFVSEDTQEVEKHRKLKNRES